MTGQYTWNFYYKSYFDYVDDWFLMSSPTTPIMIVAAYLLFVLKIGPAYMKDRPAYSLRNILHVYNAIQVLYSGFLVFIGIKAIYSHGFLETKCIFEEENEYAYVILSGGYYYLMAKLSELLDTVFFVLRKKWNQISFLHVYHHAIMFSMCWFLIKYSPTFAFAFAITLNSFVHVIMYTYYGLSAFPELAKHLWWKKYITQLQLVQFIISLIILTANFITSDCPANYFLLIFSWMNVALFIYLFTKFYLDSFTKNKDNTRNAAKDCTRSGEVKRD